MVKRLWNNDGWCMWHTNVSFITECLLDTRVSEANLACSPFLFFSVLWPLLLILTPSQPMSLFFCILWQFCFPILPPSHFYPTFKNRKDPDMGLLLLLHDYVWASYHGVSQQHNMHVATARSCGLWPINCYTTALCCFCVPLWGNLAEALNHVS